MAKGVNVYTQGKWHKVAALWIYANNKWNRIKIPKVFADGKWREFLAAGVGLTFFHNKLYQNEYYFIEGSKGQEIARIDYTKLYEANNYNYGDGKFLYIIHKNYNSPYFANVISKMTQQGEIIASAKSDIQSNIIEEAVSSSANIILNSWPTRQKVDKNLISFEEVGRFTTSDSYHLIPLKNGASMFSNNDGDRIIYDEKGTQIGDSKALQKGKVLYTSSKGTYTLYEQIYSSGSSWKRNCYLYYFKPGENSPHKTVEIFTEVPDQEDYYIHDTTAFVWVTPSKVFVMQKTRYGQYDQLIGIHCYDSTLENKLWSDLNISTVRWSRTQLRGTDDAGNLWVNVPEEDANVITPFKYSPNGQLQKYPRGTKQFKGIFSGHPCAFPDAYN